MPGINYRKVQDLTILSVLGSAYGDSAEYHDRIHCTMALSLVTHRSQYEHPSFRSLRRLYLLICTARFPPGS